MKPAVSVVIPVYNTAKYLRRCLDSVCRQSLTALEIICIDDCSSDGSAAILAEYAARDPRVKVITFAENRGAAAARNAGVDAATGDYLGFVDSDDFVELDFYAKLHGHAAKDKPDAVKGTIKVYDNERQTSRYEEWLDLNASIRRSRAYFLYTFTTAIYRRDFVLAHAIRFPEGLVHAEDPVFSVKAALFYETLVLCDDAIYYYCENRDSVSRNLTARHAQGAFDSARIILNLLEGADVSSEHRLVVFDFVMDQLISFYRHESSDLRINEIAAKGISEALARCPTSVERWLVFRARERARARYEFCMRELRRNVKERKGLP